jgi:glycosyltransferase involved in cell wall biosynthesis
MDDGSSDGTGDIARSQSVNVLRNEKNIGKAQSIQRAARHWTLTENYDVICLMDADTEVNANYFQSCIAEFDDPKVAAVCGRALSVPHNWLTAYRSLAYWISHAIYKGGQSSMGVITVAPAAPQSFERTCSHNWIGTPTPSWKIWIALSNPPQADGEDHLPAEGACLYAGPINLQAIKQMYHWDVGAWQVGKKYQMVSGLRRVDFEYKLLMGEGIVFATIFLLIPLWLLLWPVRVGLLLGGEFVFQIGLSLVCALCDRRKDVVLSSFAFPFLRFIGCGVFVTAFWRVMVQRQQIHTWFAAKRY